jgi:hypothetical protein
MLWVVPLVPVEVVLHPWAVSPLVAPAETNPCVIKACVVKVRIVKVRMAVALADPDVVDPNVPNAVAEWENSCLDNQLVGT